MRKSSTIKSLCLVVAFVFTGFAANAQLTHLEQSVFLNFNAPMAEFNNDLTAGVLLSGDQIPLTRFNVGKNAAFGFGLGYRISYRFDVGFGEVSPYIHADFQWNRTKSDVRDKFLDADGKAPNYFNIPIFIGVNYRYQINDIITPFGEFGLGPDFLLIGKEAGSVSYNTITPTGAPLTVATDFDYKYKFSSNLAWQVGAGCYFGEHVSASIHYNGFGKHSIKPKDSQTDVMTAEYAADTKTQNRNLGLLSIRIGFHF